MPEYHLQIATDSVDLWLTKRMPLEPTGSLHKARVELRSALRDMRCPTGAILSAEYSSEDQSFFDVENVLIYNVGTGTFRHLSENGLSFRRHRQVPVPTPLGGMFPHHHRYQFVPTPLMPSGPTFQFHVPHLSSTLKPHHVWWYAADALSQAERALDGTFSLHVAVTTIKRVTNVAAALKPLLDGVVCAMHSDSMPNEEAVRRLSEKTGWDSALVAKKLSASSSPLLGDRRLLNPYREYVKWDPADHLCELCTLTVSRGTSESCLVTVVSHKRDVTVAQPTIQRDVSASGGDAR